MEKEKLVRSVAGLFERAIIKLRLKEEIEKLEAENQKANRGGGESRLDQTSEECP